MNDVKSTKLIALERANFLKITLFMTYLRKDTTPRLPLENASRSFFFLYLLTFHLGEVCETNKVEI